MLDIQAVIWDFGGVISSSPFESFNRYERERGLPANFLRSVNAVNPLDNAWAKLERSDCSLSEFDALFAAESAARATGRPAPMCSACSMATCGPRWCRHCAGFARSRRSAASPTTSAPIRPRRAPAARPRSWACSTMSSRARGAASKAHRRIYLMMTEALAVAPGACTISMTWAST